MTNVIGEYIREKRAALHYSEADISKLIGLSVNTIKMIEEGKSKLRLETACTLSKALKFSLDDMAAQYLEAIK